MEVVLLLHDLEAGAVVLLQQVGLGAHARDGVGGRLRLCDAWGVGVSEEPARVLGLTLVGLAHHPRARPLEAPGVLGPLGGVQPPRHPP